MITKIDLEVFMNIFSVLVKDLACTLQICIPYFLVI